MIFKVALIVLGSHEELLLHCDGFEAIIEFLKDTLPMLGIIQMENVINKVIRVKYSRKDSAMCSRCDHRSPVFSSPFVIVCQVFFGCARPKCIKIFQDKKLAFRCMRSFIHEIDKLKSKQNLGKLWRRNLKTKVHVKRLYKIDTGPAFRRNYTRQTE